MNHSGCYTLRQNCLIYCVESFYSYEIVNVRSDTNPRMDANDMNFIPLSLSLSHQGEREIVVAFVDSYVIRRLASCLKNQKTARLSSGLQQRHKNYSFIMRLEI